MFVNNDQQQEFVTLEPGTHRMKVTGCEERNEKFFLTFKKDKFHTNAFFKTPVLKEDGTPESWANVVGGRGGWFVSTKIWFEEAIEKVFNDEGKKEINRIVSEVSAKITSKYPTFEEQYATRERVFKASAFLFRSFVQSPKLKDVWFDVDLEESVYLDKEGNEKKGLRVVRGTADNNWKVPYRVSEDQTPDVAPPEDNPEDNVPDWVNEERPTRQEPVAEW